ncbi:MAG: peptidoglycan DD-metalloendopeptidase family protein [Anaerolineae bacterium]
MAVTRQALTEAERRPVGDYSLERLAQQAVLVWQDTPLLARVVSHLVVLALVFLAGLNAIPSDLQAPSSGWGWIVAPGTFVSQRDQVFYWSRPENNTRFLEHNAVPFTVNPMRDILPVENAQRTVRMTILSYRVQPGDTVLGIAESFGLKGSSLLWANEKLEQSPDFLQVGQELQILPVDGAYHTVVSGETLESIAAKYKVDPVAITGFSTNELQEGAALQAEQRIIIPGGVKPYVPRTVVATQQAQASAPADAEVGSGNFAWPTSGTISQRYWEGHRAIDIAGSTGNAVVAADAGYISTAQSSRSGYGNMLIVDHGNGYQTLYAHLSAFSVEVGQAVNKGEVIGLRGSTGNSTGPHLHFEVIKSGVRRNPFDYLP